MSKRPKKLISKETLLTFDNGISRPRLDTKPARVMMRLLVNTYCVVIQYRKGRRTNSNTTATETMMMAQRPTDPTGPSNHDPHIKPNQVAANTTAMSTIAGTIRARQ